MKLSLLIGVALATATPTSYPWLPCGIPFPLDNVTAPSALDSPTNDGIFGAANAFDNGAGGPQPWPRNSKNEVHITYCFTEIADRIALKPIIGKAIKAWEDKLGGDASKSAGHAIRWFEALDSRGNPKFCKDRSNDNQWNDQIPYETLPIEYWENQGQGATMGLMKKDPPAPWLMHMHLGSKDDLADAMHELGHVMGMAHEHQRMDRDKYMSYHCENLADFDEKYKKAKEDDPALPILNFCNDLKIAAKYKFRGFDYVKGKAINQDWTIKGNGPYDIHSIMHYGTKTDANGKCFQGLPEHCALVRWKDPDNHKWPEVDPQPEYGSKPSGADLAWVKKTYPWMDPPQ